MLSVPVPVPSALNACLNWCVEALKTAAKLLDNVIGRPGDLKTRSIRLGNAAFHAKLGRFPGGIDVLKAAGFREVIDGGVPHLQLSPVLESTDVVMACVPHRVPPPHPLRICDCLFDSVSICLIP